MFWLKGKKEFKTPKAILIAHIGHLGDLVIATSVLPEIRKAYPGAIIGCLCGSWAKELMQNHQLICQVHYFDHVKLNRTSSGFFKSLITHFRTARIAKRAIKRVGYDLAIELNPFFPNSIYFLYRAKISRIIGYGTAGFRSLLTEAIYIDSSRYMSYNHLNVLKTLIRDELPLKLRASINIKPDHARIREKYICIHMGSGDPLKEWEEEKWKELVERLSNLSILLVFTGKGRLEKERVERVSSKAAYYRDLCDQLPVADFVQTVRHASLLISVDTAAVHIAAAFDTPNLILFSGIQQPKLWKPESPYVVAEYRSFSSIQSINGISVDAVYEKVLKLKQADELKSL